jgi:hypothetical protein
MFEGKSGFIQLTTILPLPSMQSRLKRARVNVEVANAYASSRKADTVQLIWQSKGDLYEFE